MLLNNQWVKEEIKKQTNALRQINVKSGRAKEKDESSDPTIAQSDACGVSIRDAPVFLVPGFRRTPYSFTEIITDTA